MINSIFQLQMSDSSKNDSSNRPGCNSDGEFSMPSSYGSKVQDCRKRLPQPLAQIQGNSWVLHAQITIDQLHTDSDGMAAGLQRDVENEDRINKINIRLQSLFGAQFEILFGKHLGNGVYFVIFCNLINILDIGPIIGEDPDGKIKIEIHEFLQLRKPRAVTALHKLLEPFVPDFSGYWERCVGGLFGHAGYTECLRPESAWFKLHHTGDSGKQHKQTPSESKAPCHPGITRDRHVCNIFRFLLFQHRITQAIRLMELLFYQIDDGVNGAQRSQN